ncbi:secretin N-terminal domain-containing protein [Rubripirellula amarantea]|uniref:secretin N-terminal domain-containing protein n=1 Tax=Rubripirellula amarantea TaxID=2527999 RepID=UPI001F5FC0FE|nr:secretin N-terminal domain-containing protein [Rubripirellula amarantea]
MFDRGAKLFFSRISLLCLLFSLVSVFGSAQEIKVIGPDGKPIVVQATPGRPMPGPPGQPGKPGEPSTGESADKDKDSKKDGANENDSPEPKVIRRDSTLDEKADPDEFKAKVGTDGKIAFEFRNQPWVDLVQWLAEISELPLDWLELPGDRVNLRSPGRYTVEETRDLFNRYLLARGYTLLEIDGGLTVAKTATINPAIVPRVAPDDLGKLPSHSFVRTSLDVGWLSAEKLSAELGPMISSNGKLTALTTTNRIEAMDAAVNLRQIANLLAQERDATSQEALAPEFVLRHLPAEDAKRMLEQFLGVEKKEAAPMTPQQMRQMQQMQQQNGGAPPAEKKTDEVSIVANTRQNSILIRAPADRVAIAREFLKRIDVPGSGMANLMDVTARVQVFRLASLDPEKLIEIVSEMNVLEPSTRIRTDKDNNAIIVSGSIADRYIINSMIERLDGSGRSFEVLPLRRLDAVEVAESISFLMGQKEEEEKSSGRRSYYMSYYNQSEEESKEQDEFRVAANTRLKQILLWANDQEMDQVRSLLIKLGELPPPGGSGQTIRVLDASATPETLEYLQRLRRQWNRLSPNPLELPDEDEFTEPNERVESEEVDDEGTDGVEDAGELLDEDDDAKPVGEANEGNVAGKTQDRNLTFTQFANGPNDNAGEDIQSMSDFERKFGKQKDSKPKSESPRSPEPIRIELDPQGNLILSSSDTAALDQLENLMLQVKPPKRPYVVFHIEHASATWMKINLEDYFKDLEEEEDSNADSFFRWYWGGDDEKDESPKGLGKGVKLRFVDDLDTNTLVVNGANSEQLQTIKELIELWDVPEPVNKRKTRFTKLVEIKYGKAEKIAETVKEAYRDLLSSNDKTFVGGGGAGGGRPGGKGNDVAKSRGGSGTGLEDSQSGSEGGGADFSFKGKLSLGIDSVGNTLLVSAEGEPLLDLVANMIGQLDDASRPQGDVKIVKLSGDINSDSLENALKALKGGSSAGGSASGGSNNGSDDGRNRRGRGND